MWKKNKTSISDEIAQKVLKAMKTKLDEYHLDVARDLKKLHCQIDDIKKSFALLETKLQKKDHQDKQLYGQLSYKVQSMDNSKKTT